MGEHREFLLLFCGGLVFLSVMPVHADLMVPTITHVYFEKDGRPFHGNAEYTVTCYGYENPGWPHRYITMAPGSSEPYEVYRYSASCPDYGCTVFEPYYYKLNIIDRCDLTITAERSLYTIRNFSALPYTHCTHLPTPEVLFPNRTGGVFYLTPEYLSCRAYHYSTDRTGRNWTIETRAFVTCDPLSDEGCVSLFTGIQPVREVLMNRTPVADPPWARMNGKDMVNYLATCNPASDPACGGWTVDEILVKNIPGLRPFAGTSSPRNHPCDTFLVNVPPGLMVPEKIVTSRYWDNEYMAADACELRVTIPTGNGSGPVQSLGSQPAEQPVKAPDTSSPLLTTLTGAVNRSPVHCSPVESLYCSIIQFLGGKCE